MSGSVLRCSGGCRGSAMSRSQGRPGQGPGMSLSFTRRSALVAGVGAGVGAAAVAVPATAAQADATSRGGGAKVRFTLNAETLDGGEQVVAVTLDTSRIGAIDPASLTETTFTVHAKAVNPIAGQTGG